MYPTLEDCSMLFDERHHSCECSKHYHVIVTFESVINALLVFHFPPGSIHLLFQNDPLECFDLVLGNIELLRGYLCLLIHLTLLLRN